MKTTDKLYEKISKYISCGSGGRTEADFSLEDMLSQSYVDCKTRAARLGRDLTEMEIRSITRSVCIARGRTRVPMVRFAEYDFEQVESSMRALVGITEAHAGEPDTEFTEALLEAFNKLNILSIFKKYSVTLPGEPQ